MATIHKLFYPVSETKSSPQGRTKITMVGCGQVGTAAAFSLMLQGVCTDLALIDVIESKLFGEMLDLQHSQQFLNNITIRASTDYEVSSDSNIVVITAGARQRENESNAGLVQRNVDIFKAIIPRIVEYSPHCIIIVVSSPVDVLSYVAWRLSGFSRNRVIGTGTMLDSARFRFMLGEKMGISAQSINGYILGEQTRLSVPIWSNVNVAGVMLSSVNPDIGTPRDSEKFDKIHEFVTESSNELLKLKGYTSWAKGVCVSTLCNYILKNQTKILPLSTLAKHDGALKDLQGIDREVFLSLPCVVTSSGVSHVIIPTLSDDEKEKLFSNAKDLEAAISRIQW